jgi:hypothetical protein
LYYTRMALIPAVRPHPHSLLYIHFNLGVRFLLRGRAVIPQVMETPIKVIRK